MIIYKKTDTIEQRDEKVQIAIELVKKRSLAILLTASSHHNLDIFLPKNAISPFNILDEENNSLFYKGKLSFWMLRRGSSDKYRS